MAKILFLSHRIPFPPNKGDKIRSYHLLRHLAEKHEVYLAAFVDDARDWQYREALEGICAEVKLLGLSPLRRRLRSLSGLARGEPLSVPYYRSPELRTWIDRLIQTEGIACAFAFSSPMAQYFLGPQYAGLTRVADFCDVDSDKWQQYANSKSLPTSWLYGREARKLLQFERQAAANCDYVLFVSRGEADLFKALAPGVANRIGFFDNGVDTAYFDPAIPFASPFGETPGPVVVFTGAMDYLANVDAVAWFVQTTWPLVRAQASDASFWIVGSNPTHQVRALQRIAGVRVTGRVADIRPYLAHARLAVAPLRIARGTQNKVLEALAMARAVACTPAAAAGICFPPGVGFRVAAEPADLARALLELFDHGANPSGRQHVLARYNWDENLAVVDRLLVGSAVVADGRTPR